MRLRRVKILSAQTCGGLLDGFEFNVGDRSPDRALDPLCLVGPNGSGKSQFLQVLAEIFQSIYHRCVPEHERIDKHPRLEFELEYELQGEFLNQPTDIRWRRHRKGRRFEMSLEVDFRRGKGWQEQDLDAWLGFAFLPSLVIGYTSGDNETLSWPFFLSRSGYAKEVAAQAFEPALDITSVPEPKLMLIDYSTNLEVLVANLLLGGGDQTKLLLEAINTCDIHSLRCVIQLNHSAAPTNGIKLTKELRRYIACLRSCATCYDYEPKDERHTFDFWINAASREAFGASWGKALDLYETFHKFAMLNDLVISKKSRMRFNQDIQDRRFSAHLPEPEETDKCFRFDRVTFRPRNLGAPVDYVALSDGEHQLAQILGVFCMVKDQNAVFLLDEPESHFNPQWRVQFISQLTQAQATDDPQAALEYPIRQECLLTTHAPFVASDMRRENVFIFSKGMEGVEVRHPDFETFGTTFDNILEECFGVRPPISELSKELIQDLKESNDPEAIEERLGELGYSIEKVLLADKARQLRKAQVE